MKLRQKSIIVMCARQLGISGHWDGAKREYPPRAWRGAERMAIEWLTVFICRHHKVDPITAKGCVEKRFSARALAEMTKAEIEEVARGDNWKA